MKKIISIILFTITFLASAQTTTDNTVVQASRFISEQEYSSALKTLEKGDKNDYRVQFFLIVAEFKLLQQSGNTDFYSVNTVRDKVKIYLAKFPTKNLKFTTDVKDINGYLDEMNPAKNLEEHEAIQNQKEKIRVGKLKTERLKVLQENLYSENYYGIKSKVRSYETDSLLEPYQLEYYKSSAEYGLLKMNEAFEITDVQLVKKQLTDYLSNYDTSDSGYTTSIQTALQFLNENFPKTQEELLSKRAEIAKAKYQQQLKTDYDEIKRNYLNNYYLPVIEKANLYPLESEFSEDVNYYKALSQYAVFMETGIREFNNISQLRNDLQEFINNKKFSNSLYKKEVENKLTYINTAFPKTLQEFNDQKDQAQKKLLKEREDQQKAAKQLDRKQAQSRRMSNGFFAIGYEGGTIAKYGIRIEKGGGSTIGFFLNARTSLVNDADLQSGKVVENKNEAVAGPSIKIAPWMLLNIGGGYGFHKFAARNDYASTMNLEKKEYVVGYGGVTFRLGSRVNILGGASFIDITEDFYTPEYTFGLTINLK